MKKINATFNRLTAYHHFLVFLIILTVLKIANVFITDGVEAGIHFTKLGVGLIIISSILHMAFSKFFDQNKKYLHSLISTFLIILMLSHADPEPVRGILVIVLLYVSKFFVKYKGRNIFNPVIFSIGVTTIVTLFIPFMDAPPLDFTGIDIRFPIFGMEIPLSILPIILALIFNVKRIKKHALALSFISTSLLLGFFIKAYMGNSISYVIIILFIGAAVIIEPKTSPTKRNQQLIFGIVIAVLIAGFTMLGIPNSIAIGLLLGNIGYFTFQNKLISR